MPYLHLTFGQPPDKDTCRFLARYATALLADVLHKRPEVTAVHIGAAAPGRWFVGGEACPAHQMAAHADLYITAGTNSADEKASFIASLDRLLKETFGDLPEASYTVIHEIAATDWGYDGQTQAARRHAATAPISAETLCNTLPAG